MSVSWERRYPEIERIIGINWLNDPKNQAHPLFDIDDGWYLTNLNKYLENVQKRKRTRDQLRDQQQFWDIYYEFEIAYFLKKFGLKPELHETICGIETDIFLKQEKLVIEIKHLRIPHAVLKKAKRFDPKAKSHPIPNDVNITYLNMKRMRSYLEQKRFQNIYPHIVFYCPDIMAGRCYDLKNLIEKSQIPREVSALAIWKNQEITCYLESPFGKKLEWKSSELQNFFK
jgi:hypothetical protein